MPATTVFYSSSGNDTTASGSRAPDNSVTGENGDISGTTITLNETVNFFGVRDDGTDIIWYEGTAGDRHLFTISSFTGGLYDCTAIVVDQTATGSRTASNWAVGGIRRSFTNDTLRTDTVDCEAGWKCEFLDTGPFTNTVACIINAGDLTSGPVTIQAASGVQATVKWTGAYSCFTVNSSGYAVFKRLSMSNSVTISASAIGVTSATAPFVRMVDCSINTYGRSFYGNNASRIQFIGCTFRSTNAVGIDINGGRQGLEMVASTIWDCGSHGIMLDSGSSLQSTVISGCKIYECDGSGIYFNISLANVCLGSFKNNTIHNNGAAGILLAGVPHILSGPITAINNIFTDNGTYGIDIGAGATIAKAIIYSDYNAYRGNGTNDTVNTTNGLEFGENSIVLTADPYTDKTADDFSLNAIEGGGLLCKNSGIGSN
jgi:hypothetical protein